MSNQHQLTSAVGGQIIDGAGGLGIQQMKDVPAVWGLITKAGPPRSPDFFEWKQVEPDDDGRWQLVEDVTDAEAPYGSIITQHEDEDILLDPAVEINGGSIELNSVVRLIPTRLIVDQDKSISGQFDDHWVHRAWLFSNPQGGIRPFVLTGTLIGAGGDSIGTAGEKDLEIAGEFLDNPGEEVTLYPAHQSGFPAGDEFLALGIGRGPGNYFRGTYGWAKWVAKATAEEGSTSSAGNTNIEWRGEWQIVTLYADLIQQVRVYDAAIAPGERGKAQLWWIDKHVNHTGDFAIDPKIENSTWQIELFNDTDVELAVGAKVKAYFSRPHYVWVPFRPPNQRTFACVQTGWTNTRAGSAASETVSVKSCDYDDSTTETGDAFDVQTVPKHGLDTALFTAALAKAGRASIIEWAEEAGGDKVIVSSIWDDPFGTVKFEAVQLANIRDGWELCDGDNGTVDLQAQFIMSVDDTGLGEPDEDDIGDTGGFRKHGDGTNDHDDHTKQEVVDTIGDHDTHAAHTNATVAAALADHPGHVHAQTGSDVTNVTAGVGFAEVPGDTASNPDQGHAGDGGADTLTHAAHSAHVIEGAEDDLDHSDTDNRPKYFVLAAIQRVS